MNSSVVSLGLSLLVVLEAPCAEGQPTQTPLEIHAVVVTTFEESSTRRGSHGEFERWVARFPLPVVFDFPQGYQSLRYNPEQHVLGIVTGEGTARAASSVMALGMDGRFDLRKAYWLVAGIAGVNPDVASIGSAAWAEWVVDGDLAYEIDARQIPPDWTTGYVPFGRSLPYEQPTPVGASSNGTNVFHLNAGLVNWAYELTQHIKLQDTAQLQEARQSYSDLPNAFKPPFVFKGDDVAASTFWLGTLFNKWAETWVSYWTHGKGSFAVTEEEDTGILQSIAFLGNAGKVDPNRVMILRTGSDYSAEAKNQSPAEMLHELQSGAGALPGAYESSLESAYEVGSYIIKEISENWQRYGERIPFP